MPAKKPRIEITYNNTVITRQIADHLISLTYHDKTESNCDDLDIELDDTIALWRNEWYPEKGATLNVKIGYDNQLVSCGDFVLDEVELSGAPDVVHIRGLSAIFKPAMRTKRSKAYEKQTLKQIAQAVAQLNGLTIVGDVPNISFKRVTQHQETDLGFLKRIASEYGVLFNVKGSNLIFQSIFEIENAPSIYTVKRGDMLKYRITDKFTYTFAQAQISYHNPQTKKVEGGTFSWSANPTGTILEAATVTTYNSGLNTNLPSNNAVLDGNVALANAPTATNDAGIWAKFNKAVSIDTLNLYTKTENGTQSARKVQTALWKANSKQKSGTITVQGNPLLVAGNNITIEDLGVLSAKYFIEESTHTITKGGGYITELTIKGIIPVKKAVNKLPSVLATTPPDANIHRELLYQSNFLLLKQDKTIVAPKTIPYNLPQSQPH